MVCTDLTGCYPKPDDLPAATFQAHAKPPFQQPFAQDRDNPENEGPQQSCRDYDRVKLLHVERRSDFSLDQGSEACWPRAQKELTHDCTDNRRTAGNTNTGNQVRQRGRDPEFDKHLKPRRPVQTKQIHEFGINLQQSRPIECPKPLR